MFAKIPIVGSIESSIYFCLVRVKYGLCIYLYIPKAIFVSVKSNTLLVFGITYYTNLYIFPYARLNFIILFLYQLIFF